MKKEAWPINRFTMICSIALATLVGFGTAYWLLPRPMPLPATSPEVPISSNRPTGVNIPAAYVSAAHIAVESITLGTISTEILAPATVTAPPNTEATVVARASGTVKRILHQPGDTIHAGEVLALVDSIEAASMSAERSTAAARVDIARKNYKREASLYQQGVSPRQDMETAQSALAIAEAELKRALIILKAAHVEKDGHSIAVISPINGKITSENITLGAFVQAHTELFQISRTEDVQIEASISAIDLPHILKGDTATILSTNGNPIPAAVHTVTPTVNPSTHTATVILKPTLLKHQLVIGEGVQVRIHARGNTTKQILVPEDAVQNIENHDVLFIRTLQGFRAQQVLVGMRNGGLAQIISGIEGHEKIATRNAFLIKAEMNKSMKEEE